MEEPPDFGSEQMKKELDSVNLLVEFLGDMGPKAYRFEDNAFIVVSEEHDMEARFISVRDEPEVSIRGGKILATASRLQLVEEGTVKELPVRDAVTITLGGVDPEKLRELSEA